MPIRKKTGVTQQSSRDRVRELATTSQDITSRSSCDSKTVISKKTNTNKAIVTALKENNKCLAAALDDSRHDYTNLKTKYVHLQQERQQLLEKINSLEIKIQAQSMDAQMQPTCDLLEQAAKDISCAGEKLRGILSSKMKEQQEPNFNTITESSPILPENGIIRAFTPITCASDGTKDYTLDGKARIHHRSLPSEPWTPVNSTPNCDSDISAKGFPVYQPCVLKLEDSIIETNHTDSSGGPASETCAEEGTMPLETQTRDHFEFIDSMSNLVLRPQRKCTTVNISYQEPGLKRRLRKDDHNVDSSVSVRALRKSKERSCSTLSKQRQRQMLHDISNKIK